MVLFRFYLRQQLDVFSPGGQCHMTEQTVNWVSGDSSTDFFLHETEAFLHTFLSLAINPSSH